MTPHQTMIIEGDISLSYPVNNTVPTVPWLIVFFAVPFIGITIFFASTEKRTQLNTLRVVYFMALAFCINESVTSVMKNVTGRPRPCFFERCGYPQSSVNGTRIFGTIGHIVDMKKCTGTEKHIKDSLRSYPSGHASHTMLDATFTSILLVGSVWQVKGWKRSVKRGLISAIILVCLSVPLYVGSSRIWDYKHRGDDVIAGYIVGALSAFLAYYLTFGWKWVRSCERLVENRSDNKEMMQTVNNVV
ncbi:lipid phosphatase [Blastocystis sp. subtype 4]|uniref:lipid phosphatase n=1 Tax=Blastocystis sp. subtype 4 TaxID=944170 RepID=UPI00071160C5|nr:lipid phosphatase [Blastocystis sp. subtype 4]KNB42928.1 lipid phosphatase [Blastocystis sp. subtype 4]|eukprot:XP_014526371.1 lipid phosphatase [Blastocystis sp. subtype 4]